MDTETRGATTSTVRISPARPTIHQPRLEFLAGYLWFASNEGSHIITRFATTTSDGFRVELCHSTFSGGDWCTCDRATLLQTTYVESAEGVVTISQPETLLEVDGDCHGFGP